MEKVSLLSGLPVQREEEEIHTRKQECITTEPHFTHAYFSRRNSLCFLKGLLAINQKQTPHMFISQYCSTERERESRRHIL